EVIATPILFRRRPSLLLVLRDATARRLVQAELERSQERFRLITESLPDHAVVALDGEGRIVAWNGGAERMFGYGAAEAVGRELCFLCREEDVAAGRPQAELSAALELGRFEGEAWRRQADGTLVWTAVTLVPQHKADGRLIGFAATFRDLTERREAQEALRRTEEQLRHAQRMEAVGRLAAGVAHDFNNLLTAIRGYARLLADELGDDPRAADLEEIRKAADRGTSLTRQLLAVGRRQLLQPRVLDLNGVITESEKLLRHIVGADVQVETRLDPALGTVKADPAQMEQVLMNLIVNAHDAMPEGGSVTIGTRNDGSGLGARVLLTVSDTGVGMDADTQQRIFEPFFTTKPPGKGTGLGLSTVYGIVQQSGGTITVTSAPGKGATFEIALPRLNQPESTTEHEPATVLVAVQDRVLRTLARRALERRGYAVLEAESSGDAVRVARACPRPVRLLIADSTMKGPGGRALVEALAGACAAERVLYVSDEREPASSRPGSSADAEVISKPFT
ncbi:MAG TPA: ATP-binding protein, partial [Longimicrobiales bacterium]